MSGAHAGLRLPAAPESIAAARTAVRGALADWDLDHLTDTAALLLSELATNAVLHARTDFEVRTERFGDTVRLSVLDASTRQPVRRRYGLAAGTGRGLGLVGTLAASWGSGPAEPPWAKAVWFELDGAAGHESGAEGALYGEDWLAVVADL